MSTSLTTTTALLFTLLTALTTAAPGADPIADAYAFALAQDRSIPSITKDYNQGSSYGGSGGVDTEAGASGNSGSFKLSNGAIAAIAVVCAVVVIFGSKYLPKHLVLPNPRATGQTQISGRD